MVLNAQVVWKCQLSLQHIVAACPDALVLVASLLQRRQDIHASVHLRGSILAASLVCLFSHIATARCSPLMFCSVAWAGDMLPFCIVKGAAHHQHQEAHMRAIFLAASVISMYTHLKKEAAVQLESESRLAPARLDIHRQVPWLLCAVPFCALCPPDYWHASCCVAEAAFHDVKPAAYPRASILAASLVSQFWFLYWQSHCSCGMSPWCIFPSSRQLRLMVWVVGAAKPTESASKPSF